MSPLNNRTTYKEVAKSVSNFEGVFVHSYSVNSADMFEHNCEIRTINPRNGICLYRSHFRLTTVQKGPFYSGVKIYIYLVSNIKSLIHGKGNFKTALKTYFCHIPSVTFLLFFRRMFQFWHHQISQFLCDH
jgi:hypothetical protein